MLSICIEVDIPKAVNDQFYSLYWIQFQLICMHNFILNIAMQSFKMKLYIASYILAENGSSKENRIDHFQLLECPLLCKLKACSSYSMAQTQRRHVARKFTWGVCLEEKWTSSIIQQQPKRTQLSPMVLYQCQNYCIQFL